MTRRKVIWYPSAIEDLDRLIEHLDSVGSGVNADRLLERLEAAANSLRTSAMRGRMVPELAAHGLTRYRELIESRWRLVYQVEPHEVRIVTLVDARRDLRSLLLERLVRTSE